MPPGGRWIAHADHNIGGIVPAVADDMRERKATYVYSAGRESAAALESGLAVLASRVSVPTGCPAWPAVFNSLGWESSAVVRVMVPEPGQYQVVDLAAAKEFPVNSKPAAPGLNTMYHLWPPECRRLEHVLTASNRFHRKSSACFDRGDLNLSNAAFQLRLDPLSGALGSFYDVEQKRELVNSAAVTASTSSCIMRMGFFRPQPCKK